MSTISWLHLVGEEVTNRERSLHLCGFRCRLYRYFFPATLASAQALASTRLASVIDRFRWASDRGGKRLMPGRSPYRPSRSRSRPGHPAHLRPAPPLSFAATPLMSRAPPKFDCSGRPPLSEGENMLPGPDGICLPGTGPV